MLTKCLEHVMSVAMNANDLALHVFCPSHCIPEPYDGLDSYLMNSACVLAVCASLIEAARREQYKNNNKKAGKASSKRYVP